LRLTDITIRALVAPEKGQRLYYDDTLPSFGCRVSQGGTRSFFVQHGADRQFTTIGRYPVVSLADARAEAKRILAERTLGKHRTRSIAWDEARTLFIAASQKKNRPRTVSEYARQLDRHFAFGKKHLSDITPQDITRKLDHLTDTQSEQSHALAAAKIFFRWAQRRHYIDHSPCEAMQIARRPTRDRVLTDAELIAVYKSARSGEDNFSRIVALLLLTGQRRTEIASLRWEWIDEIERTISLPSSITKNKRAHTFPYGSLVAGILDGIPHERDYLFPASRSNVRGKPTTCFNGWPKGKVTFDKRCTIAPWTLHDLRRTYATVHASLGTPPHIVERLLNHASGTISGVAAIYNRFQYMDEMRAAINTWEARLAALLKSY
jgi:integrase